MRSVRKVSTLKRKSLFFTLLATLFGLAPGLSQSPAAPLGGPAKPPTTWPVDRILVHNGRVEGVAGPRGSVARLTLGPSQRPITGWPAPAWHSCSPLYSVT